VPVNTIVNIEADYKIDENIDYYDLQNVCEETTSLKDIGKCKYLFYKLKNNNYHIIIFKHIRIFILILFLGHYDVNETMVQSQDDNLIIELNEWNEIFDCLNESTNHPENGWFTSL